MPNQTILLIDYEPRSIDRFRQPLTDAGYTVEVATDGLTGIEAFHRLNPDMVLVEAMIPKKHGFEVCQELKRTPHGRRTPVLITTGVYKGRKYRTQALHIYGCDEYIEKPIAPEQLLAVVGKFFGPAAASASSATPDQRTTPPPEPAAIPTRESAVRPSVSADASHEPPPMRPTAPKPSAGSVAKDFTEEEIMARLDAILPGGDFMQHPMDIQPAPLAVSMTPEPMAAAPIAAAPMAAAPMPMAAAPVAAPPMADDDTTITEQDPFSQMQAELTAELGSISAALALEPAPVFDSMPQASYSDQALAPSVLEALPMPEIEPMPVPAPAPGQSTSVPEPVTDAPSSEQPGQLVNFDAKRSRRKKNGKKSQAAAVPPATPVAPPAPAPVAVVTQEAEAPRAKTATAAGPLTLPTGTLVESDLAESQVKKGVPVWVWAALAVIALIAVYFTVLRGPSMSPASQTSPGSGEAATSEPVVADSGAAESAPSGTGNSNLVLNSVGAAPRRPAGASTATATAPLAVVKKSPSLEPPPANAQQAPGEPEARDSAQPAASVPTRPEAATTAPPQLEAPKPSETITAPPSGSSDDVAGVESIVPSLTPAAAPSIAPGTLVDAEEVDTLPVSLSRKAPMYSLQARQMRLQGTVVMNVLVNERGTVDQVVLVEGVAGGDLNDAAMRAAKSWTYSPATKGGVPVKTWKVEQVAFKM